MVMSGAGSVQQINRKRNRSNGFKKIGNGRKVFRSRHCFSPESISAIVYKADTMTPRSYASKLAKASRLRQQIARLAAELSAIERELLRPRRMILLRNSPGNRRHSGGNNSVVRFQSACFVKRVAVPARTATAKRASRTKPVPIGRARAVSFVM